MIDDRFLSTGEVAVLAGRSAVLAKVINTRTGFRTTNEMGVALRISDFLSDKEGEAGHPRMVDGT